MLAHLNNHHDHVTSPLNPFTVELREVCCPYSTGGLTIWTVRAIQVDEGSEKTWTSIGRSFKLRRQHAQRLYEKLEDVFCHCVGPGSFF